ncbi:hypothetical protein FC52_GL000672 [Lactobacillus pasteurii DSM 23907 = CRBIP 24.76]|uniref:Uncharacterized protein n=1 Tax=Lactobacillus pasteurii DSM 23907 = CRBIP 24.76 TaxID=1423790 RepID=I7IYW6_9LACO|nr:hypothetical protein [Lactobacillus pasteurii]KRK07416.1 hypothetical protein FC52_GL000672 [Lactobacillus pasteurii DSM 23907 = CRBIP 24.76]TDG77643.1 hypothetical protein C5L33_000054 [Lactobacillus pasteurii]CCI84757.1 Protein of unknown function [Lactobacillus pasteurii DSM 23907 = CRBIP 24.76]
MPFKRDISIANSIEKGEAINKQENEKPAATPKHEEITNLKAFQKKKNPKKTYNFSLHEDVREKLTVEYKKRGYSSASELIEDIIKAL